MRFGDKSVAIRAARVGRENVVESALLVQAGKSRMCRTAQPAAGADCAIKAACEVGWTCQWVFGRVP